MINSLLDILFCDLYCQCIVFTASSLRFDVALQSDVRKVPVETSLSAQLYALTPDSLCCSGKDLRPQNLHREGVGK